MDFLYEGEYADVEGTDRCDGREQAVRALVEVIRPLLQLSGGRSDMRIEEEIIMPACGCSDEELEELKLLCSVFSMVLERTATAVLIAVGEYLSLGDGECALLALARRMEEIWAALEQAYNSSRVEAFATRAKQELYDERF